MQAQATMQAKTKQKFLFLLCLLKVYKHMQMRKPVILFYCIEVRTNGTENKAIIHSLGLPACLCSCRGRPSFSYYRYASQAWAK